MNYIFNFPDIGEGLDEGTIVEWLVKKGQKIEAGDNIVTMETDKVVAEIPSPKSGVVKALFGKVGDVVKVGEALIEIEIEGETSSSETDNTNSKTEAVEEEGAGVVGTLEVASNNAIMRASDEGFSKTEETQQTNVKKALATPVARAMAKDLGIDINKVKGTGPAGRVMKDDIKNYHQNYAKQTVVSSNSTQVNENRVDVEQLSQIRKTIATNMTRSKHNAAHMALFDDVEISELYNIRKKYKTKFEQENIKLTYLPFVLKAVALALKKHRQLNAELDLEGSKMIYKNYYNIGIAVDTERGLVVPVIRDVDKLSIKEIAIKVQEISEKARDNKISLDDMKDGTFSVTSYGSIGGKYAFPVINYPQAGILGIGRIFEQPIVKNGQITVGKILPLSVSVDHRIVDGGEVSRFINTVMAYLSDPVSLLFD